MTDRDERLGAELRSLGVPDHSPQFFARLEQRLAQEAPAQRRRLLRRTPAWQPPLLLGGHHRRANRHRGCHPPVSRRGVGRVPPGLRPHRGHHSLRLDSAPMLGVHHHHLLGRPVASGEGIRDEPQPFTFGAGALAGAQAELVLSPRGIPHVWALGSQLAVTVAGDAAGDEQRRTAESFAPAGQR